MCSCMELFCIQHDVYTAQIAQWEYQATHQIKNIKYKLNPQIARWDYHATHINQLLTLATVEEKKAAQILR